MNPTLSVIIPIYNVEKHIKKCAISLFEQTLENIEFVFVNDGTPDKSMSKLNDVISQYPKRQDNIKIVNHERNQGLSAARLTGIHTSNGYYIAHCDSDDWVEPNMYELMLNKAKNEDADIVCTNIFIDEGSNTIEDKYDINISTINKLDYLLNITLGGKFSAIWNKLIKRSLYFDNNVFPIKSIAMWEDIAVIFRLIYFSKKTVILHQPLYHYVNNKDSICSAFSNKHILEQIQCAEIIDNFFLDKGKVVYLEYNLPVQNLKFMAKRHYLIDRNTRNIKLWRQTFPESNKYIWKYKELSIIRRFVFGLAILGFPKISAKIFDW